ncbi:putative AAA family ATPase [Leishmania major strain Friedlin]|uniref:Putative AAA family ATPase n=1 Tax=Leishmania major TaxID=5664 RepID=Q4QHQ3_LEIMA|nr:putative AAA family ATPase [Leishmania major strain Friedlin]CAG9569738.1 AAA_family_ATPase_-__putative [Leishmania major strain Friedlin]CAJ02953.1 putative AAA family ATPase [Leishmania major strain Friedlin]|eukprot:XP_001681295.1 putative AAA family ATPase [Leishmania major strain Friedlin]
MDLLRLYVEFFLLCVQPTVPCRTRAAAAVADVGCNGSYPAAAAAKPAAVDVATQLTTLSFISVPHCVRSFLEGVALLRKDGEAAPAAAGKAGGRKRHRDSIERNGTKSVAADDLVVEGGEDSDLPYQPSVMLQRLRAYGEVQVPGFESDSAYLAAKDVLVYLKHYAYLVSGMALSAAVLRNIELVGLDFRQQCVPCMAAVTELVGHLIDAQLHKMQRLPRVVRLSERLRLSAKAAHTLEYLLVCHCGRYAAGNIAEPLRPANIAYHNDLTPQELLSILSESGVLWKQGLIFSDIKLRTTFMECKYALPIEAIAALSGDQLSEEQLIKLERTALLEVLNEERNAKTTSTAAATPALRAEEHVGGSRSVSPSPKRGDEEGDLEDEEDDDATADSAIALTEEALDSVLEDVDPAVLASKDQDAIYEAVSHRLRNALAGRTATQFGGRAVAAAPVAKNSAATETEEAVKGGKSSREESAMVAPSTAPSTAPPSRTTDTAPRPEDGREATTATSAPLKARLVLADINPLAQRYRCTGASAGAAAAVSSPSATPHTDSSMRGVPYESDIEYMDAAFRILANMIRIRYAEGDMKDEEDSYTPKSKVEASIRELKGKVRVAAAVHESRLQATLATRAFTPRIEQLAQRLQLTEMEKQIMLFMVGNVISHDMLVAVNGRYVMRDGQRLITVGYMLFVLCESLEERVVARRAFYQSSPLVSNGVLSLTLDAVGRSCFNTDLMDYLVDIDRKIVDDVMGIPAETAEMVPGSQLYFPEVELANVVLPTSTMDRVLSTIEHYSLFEQCKKSSGFGDGLGTSKGGLVMLFHGPSGTGKTMLANAVAHHLKKKILLVSVSQFRTSTKAEADALRFLFREAKLSDAIVFFDECEALFEDRTSNGTVTALLSEFERYDGLVILATNRAQNFDEAMNRRISLMMEFRPPDHQLRLRIWRSHIPKQLPVNEDVCLEKLALNYELSGGLIRNAVLAALSRAVAREKSSTPKLTMSDLDEGARLQLRGFFLAAELPEGMSEFYLTPKRTLAELVVEPDLAEKLEGIASSAKSRSTLYTEWGFSEDANDNCGALYLFQGVSGTGKSLAAEAIAYECGATIRLCNVAELLLREEMRVHVVFEEGRRLGAIIVFDEAQVLFNESPKSLQLSQLIQYHARRYPRPVIVIATTVNRDGGGGRHLFSTANINSRSSCMLFQAELTFALPRRPLREQLWRKAFPERVPTSSDVNYGRLSATSISPKLIRMIAFNVCCTAALLPVSDRVVTMAMIEAEMERTVTRERTAVSASAMFA